MFVCFLGWLLLLIFKKLFVLVIHFFLFFSIVCFSDPSQNSITGEHSQLLGIVLLWGSTLSKVTLFLLILTDITYFLNSIFFPLFFYFSPFFPAVSIPNLISFRKLLLQLIGATQFSYSKNNFSTNTKLLCCTYETNVVSLIPQKKVIFHVPWFKKI